MKKRKYLLFILGLLYVGFFYSTEGIEYRNQFYSFSEYNELLLSKLPVKEVRSFIHERSFSVFGIRCNYYTYRMLKFIYWIIIVYLIYFSLKYIFIPLFNS